MVDRTPPLQALRLYTHNVARVLKPSQDGELAHAIHETLHYALDGDAQDYLLCRDAQQLSCASKDPSTSTAIAGEGESTTEGREDIQPGFFATKDPERPFISYQWDEDAACLTLPHPLTVLNPVMNDPCTSTENGTNLRDAFDVTAKFFFLNQVRPVHGNTAEAAYPAEWIDEALDCLSTAIGLDSVDTMILAFPSLKLDCTHAHDDEIRAKASKAVDVWRHISPTKRILSLGLSDVSRRSLQAIMEQLDLPDCQAVQEKWEDAKAEAASAVEEAMVQKGNEADHELGPIRIPSSPSQVSLADRLDDQTDLLKVYGPGPCRRPRLCTINLREQSCDDNSLGGESISKTNVGTACWDRGLADYCKEQKVLLVAHSDQRGKPARLLYGDYVSHYR